MTKPSIWAIWTWLLPLIKKKNQSLRAILHFLNHQVQEFNKNFLRKSEHIQTLSIAIKIIVTYDLKNKSYLIFSKAELDE